MTDIVKGMTMHVLEKSGDTFYDDHSLELRAEELRTAMRWLASNVSDEMCAAARNVHPCTYETMIAAAIRAAAGEEG